MRSQGGGCNFWKWGGSVRRQVKPKGRECEVAGKAGAWMQLCGKGEGVLGRVGVGLARILRLYFKFLTLEQVVV